MDNRSLVLFLSGLAAAGTAVCIAVSCSDQPKPKCSTGRGIFSAVYAPKGAPGMGDCAIPGEALGVYAYNYPNADRTNADLNKGSIALKGGSIADGIAVRHDVVDPAPGRSPNSVGDFTTAEPGGDDFCNVGTMTAAEQTLPFIQGTPEMDAGFDVAPIPATPTIPGQHIKYEWSNVRVFVTAGANGTQLVGDLTYTHDLQDDAGVTTTPCSTTYRARALFPSVGCGVDTDAGTVTNFCACLPYADPVNGRATGSGIGSDFFGPETLGAGACELSAANSAALEAQSKVTCDPNLHLCVLKAEP